MSQRRPFLPPPTDTADAVLGPVQRFLDANDYSYTPVEACADPALLLDVRLQRVRVETIVTACAHGLEIRMQLPIHAPARQYPRILDCFQRINLSCWHIQWHLDPDDGGILCRQLIDCTDVSMTEDRFGACLTRQAVAVDGMCPVILAIIGGALRPAIAAEHAHASAESFIDSIVGEFPGAPPASSDPHLLN